VQSTANLSQKPLQQREGATATSFTSREVLQLLTLSLSILLQLFIAAADFAFL
jgi:hypothetical protein